MLKKKTINEVRRALRNFPETSARRKSSRSRRTEYSPRELQHFKSLLLEMMEEVKEDLRALSSAISEEQNGYLVSRQTDFLRSLEAALKRIEEGKYGRCTSCGKLIEKERLEAVPHTQLCVACKNSQKPKPVPPSIMVRPFVINGEQE